jgi:hypothetical protein
VVATETVTATGKAMDGNDDNNNVHSGVEQEDNGVGGGNGGFSGDGSCGGSGSGSNSGAGMTNN